jgi:hypothetical protein
MGTFEFQVKADDIAGKVRAAAQTLNIPQPYDNLQVCTRQSISFITHLGTPWRYQSQRTIHDNIHLNDDGLTAEES